MRGTPGIRHTPRQEREVERERDARENTRRARKARGNGPQEYVEGGRVVDLHSETDQAHALGDRRRLNSREQADRPENGAVCENDRKIGG